MSLQTNEKLLKLTTHIITPVFAKLNLLGLLHIIHNTNKTIPFKINSVGDIYEVYIYTKQGFEEEFVKTLVNITKQMLRHSEPQGREKAKRKKRKQETTERKNIVVEWFEVDQRFIYSGNKPTTLLESVENLINASNYSYNDLIELLMRPIRHDTRSSSGKSPTLLLAPDLGKYSTAQIPYVNRYPNIIDGNLDEKDIYLCTAVSLIGLHAGFKSTIISTNAVDTYIAIPSPRTSLRTLHVSALYWIGRRLSFLSQKVNRIDTRRKEERFSLSIPGLYAVLSPIIKDCITSSETLKAFEVTIYRITSEIKRGQYVRDFVNMGLDRVELMPDGISSVLLANINRLRDLIINVPEFFNLLGEYMLSGNDIIYVESLRILASALHDKDVPNSVKAVIREVLEHGAR
jgi:hypothetical protein